MSSTTYSSELRPDPALRRIVLLATVVAWCAGLAISFVLGIAWPWRALVAFGWTVQLTSEWFQITAGYKRYLSLHFSSDGAVELLTADGMWIPARVLPGSVVLDRTAWLRFEVDDGPRLLELVRGDPCESQAWRRFQVIWRHLGGKR